MINLSTPFPNIAQKTVSQSRYAYPECSRASLLSLKFQGQEPLQMMSYNVNRFSDFKNIVASIKKLSPNILLLQEVSTPEKVEALNRELGGSYKFITLFPQKEVWKKRPYCKWESSVAILSKRPAIDFPKSYKDFSAHSPCFKQDFMTYALFKTPNHHEMAVINLHLPCLYPSAQKGLAEQQEAITHVIQLVRNLKQRHSKLRYILIAGDFNNPNTTPAEKKIRAPLAEAGFVSILPPGASTHTGRFGKTTLDDFWVSPSALEDKIISPLSVVETAGSDHIPLLETLRFPVQD